jgi:hypothetical protein
METSKRVLGSVLDVGRSTVNQHQRGRGESRVSLTVACLNGCRWVDGMQGLLGVGLLPLVEPAIFSQSYPFRGFTMTSPSQMCRFTLARPLSCTARTAYT